MVFWANPIIIARFPAHAAMALSYYSAVLHEATSERTFSDCSRFLTDIRSTMSSDSVCSQVLINSGERIENISPAAIKEHYTSKRKLAKAKLDDAESLEPKLSELQMNNWQWELYGHKN
jgi:hypothetical protein